MKAKLPEREPAQLAEWEQMGLYRLILESRKDAPLFVFHDGPPYPTGEIHLGTGLNKTLKDMVVKTKTMAGFRAPYIPGWDCHGLPIETKVEKELGGKGKVSAAEFRRMCREFAAGYIEAHRREFKRLGIFGQWEKPYMTMDPSYEACIASAFLTFLEKGYVYRGLKPVYWCIFDRTALAEAEVEYEDHTSPSIWIRYSVVSAPPAGVQVKGGLYAIVWTTTPWTLPASMALAFNKDLKYLLAEDEKGDTYILAEDLLDSVANATGERFVTKAGPFPGSTFASLKFRHPFLDREIPAVFGDHVTLEQGSGIVHTAPGHGAEDFYAGQEYGLETYAPIDDEGRYVEGLPEYKGKTVFEANDSIIQLLKARGALLAEQKLTHSYPHCWRCHNPVIFRATEQWFIQMDAGSASVPAPKAPALRSLALEEIKKVKWTPEWGQERIHNMIESRPDWCISRQRFWGVPLIIFYCDACGKRLEDFKALRHVLPFFEREGADAWYTHPAEELLPPGTKCAGCGAAKWRKESDILDVWFDSGSSNLAVLDKREGKPRADVYLEGPDQFRGWFQSSLLVALGVDGIRPYEQVVTHGWTLDEKGAPMSKSLGNAMAPREIVEKWGADMLRVWVASQDFTQDVRLSDAIMVQLGEAYRKIRNTFRFALSNLFDFDPARDAVADADLLEIDAWMLRRTGELVRDCREWYANFEFHRVYHALHDFCAVDLSSVYFDVLKDRLYTFAPNNRGRRSAQTAVYRIASALLRLIAPVLVYTSEEIWKLFPRRAGDPVSVHITTFPAAEEFAHALDDARVKSWKRLLAVREDALKAMEPARAAKTISGGLEARITLSASSGLGELLRKYAVSLPALFIVSQVEIVDGPLDGASPAGTIEGLQIRVERAKGAKCERCWNYSTHVGESAVYPTLCERCLAAIAEIERGKAAGSAKS